jgi:hypothetical protein
MSNMFVALENFDDNVDIIGNVFEYKSFIHRESWLS